MVPGVWPHARRGPALA